MTEDKDAELCAKYPKIFAQRHLPRTETCMYWGLSVGNGWYKLIDELCKYIQCRIDSAEEEVDSFGTGREIPQVEATQVKEKFGGLRFYTTGGNDELNAVISFAESLSYSICEVCGTMDDVTIEGIWLSTLCRKCRAKRRTNGERERN